LEVEKHLLLAGPASAEACRLRVAREAMIFGHRVRKSMTKAVGEKKEFRSRDRGAKRNAEGRSRTIIRGHDHQSVRLA